MAVHSNPEEKNNLSLIPESIELMLVIYPKTFNIIQILPESTVKYVKFRRRT